MSIPPKLKVCGSIPERGHNIFVEFEYLSCAEAASHGPKIPLLLMAEARSMCHGPKALVAEGRRVRCAAAGLRVETSRWPPSPCAEDRKRWAIFATGTWAEGGRSRSACRINEDHESDLVCRSQVADVHCELKMDRSPRRASQSCCARLRAVPKRTSLSSRCACRRGYLRIVPAEEDVAHRGSCRRE